MVWKMVPALLLLVPGVAAAGRQPAAEAARDAHGGFTGEIKAVLYVGDVERSADFFRDVLGFALEGLTPGADGTPYYAELSAGGTRFGLHEPANEEQQERIGRARLYFRVRDLDAHRRRVEAWGARASETVETGWMDFFIVRDPDGHEIVFAVTGSRHQIDPW